MEWMTLNFLSIAFILGLVLLGWIIVSYENFKAANHGGGIELRERWCRLWDAMEPLSEAQRIQIHNTVALEIRILRDLAGESITATSSRTSSPPASISQMNN